MLGCNGVVVESGRGEKFDNAMCVCVCLREYGGLYCVQIECENEFQSKNMNKLERCAEANSMKREQFKTDMETNGTGTIFDVI